MKIFEAAKLQRKIFESHGLDSKLLDTGNGCILCIKKNVVNDNSHKILLKYANKQKLNLQLGQKHYFISTKNLEHIFISAR